MMLSVSIKIKHLYIVRKRKWFAVPVQSALHRNFVVLFHFSAWMMDKLDEALG